MPDNAPDPARATYKRKELCSVKYCLNPRAVKKRSSMCHKHIQQQWRKNNPLTSTYARLKASAKSRGIEFSISLEEFLAFCAEKGYPAKGMHLDREDATKGYILANIQVLTATDNVVKGNKERATEQYKAEYVKRKLFVRKAAEQNVEACEEVGVEADEEMNVEAKPMLDVEAPEGIDIPF